MAERIEKETLYIDVDNGVATITLNRPEVRNALNRILLLELMDAVNFAESSDGIRAIVITGEGPVFCAGGDFNWFLKLKDEPRDRIIPDLELLSLSKYTIYESRLPTIAKVRGAAIGGGCGIVVACDFAVASEETMFGASEVRIGLVPAPFVQLMVKKLGEGTARRLMLSGERIDAREAFDCGLISKISKSGELDTDTEKLVNAILAGGPEAVNRTKDLIRQTSRMETSANGIHQILSETLADSLTADEAREGMTAFLEKREPKWKIKS